MGYPSLFLAGNCSKDICYIKRLETR